MTNTPLMLQIEAVLFVASDPLTTAELAAITGTSETKVKQALTALAATYQNRGIRLSHLEEHYQLVTAPEATAAIENFFRAEAKAELSKPALETLSIIAYRGPVARSVIETIRGVSSGAMIRHLLARGLIRETGHSQEPGSPLQYAISHAFLQTFGLTDTSQLPTLPNAAENPPRRED